MNNILRLAFFLWLTAGAFGQSAGYPPFSVNSPTNGQVLQYNSSTGFFQNASVITGGTVSNVSGVPANGVTWSISNPSTTPALTIALGAITPTTVDGLTISTTTNGILTISNSKRLSVSNTLTFAGTDGTTFTFPGASDTVAALGTTETFTAPQTFPASGIILGGASSGVTTFASANASASNYTITFPAATGTVALTSQTTTLTGDVTGTGSGSIATTVGAIGGEAVSLAGTFTTSGAHALVLTTTNSTNVTLPTSGTLATTSQLPSSGSPLGAASGGTGVSNNAANTLTFSGNYGLTLTLSGTSSITLPTSGTMVTTSVTALSSLVTVGTIGTGTWQGTAIAPGYGGTGEANNSANTLTFSGNYGLTLTLTNTTSVTLPTSGTLAALGGTNTWTGVNTFSSATAATSTTTGAIVLSGSGGGIGLAGNIFAGGNINAAGTGGFVATGTNTLTPSSATGQFAHSSNYAAAVVGYNATAGDADVGLVDHLGNAGLAIETTEQNSEAVALVPGCLGVGFAFNGAPTFPNYSYTMVAKNGVVLLGSAVHVGESQQGWEFSTDMGNFTSAFSLGAGTGTVLNFYSNAQAGVCGSISITSAGAATAYNTSSDQRMKADFKPWSLGDDFDRIEIGSFKWKEAGSIGHGVLAQRLYEIYPDAVTKGDDDPTAVAKAWGVDYGKLVIPTIARVQEIDKRLASLSSNPDMFSRCEGAVAILLAIVALYRTRTRNK